MRTRDRRRGRLTWLAGCALSAEHFPDAHSPSEHGWPNLDETQPAGRTMPLSWPSQLQSARELVADANGIRNCGGWGTYLDVGGALVNRVQITSDARGEPPPHDGPLRRERRHLLATFESGLTLKGSV